MSLPNAAHNGLPRPSSLQQGVIVLDRTQSLEEAAHVRTWLDTLLARVDPDKGSWCPQEAHKRQHAERN
jgi:hypothetical protein